MAEQKVHVETKQRWWKDQSGCVRNLIALAALLVSLVPFGSCIMETSRAGKLEKKVDELTKSVAALKGQAESKDVRIKDLQRQLDDETKQSLSAFVREYRQRIKEASEAVRQYKEFDTPGNRREYGANFENQQMAKLQAAKDKLTSLVDHVERWKTTVLAALEKVMNGRVTALKAGLAGNNAQEILSRFASIQDNIEGDIELLIRALEAAILKAKQDATPIAPRT